MTRRTSITNNIDFCFFCDEFSNTTAPFNITVLGECGGLTWRALQFAPQPLVALSTVSAWLYVLAVFVFLALVAAVIVFIVRDCRRSVSSFVPHAKQDLLDSDPPDEDV